MDEEVEEMLKMDKLIETNPSTPADEGMFGVFQHSMDSKGRLFVPSRLREALGSPFYVMVGFGNYLLAFPAAKWRMIMAKIYEIPLTESPRFRIALANAAKCEPDKQGRFLLPIKLRQRAELVDEVTIIGQGDHAEIWNSAAYDAIEQKFFAEGDLAKDMKALGF